MNREVWCVIIVNNVEGEICKSVLCNIQASNGAGADVGRETMGPSDTGDMSRG